MKHDLQRGADNSELQHHFHQYFELLLGVEKERLQHAVATAPPERAAGFQYNIDERFAYLKGAVRMGRLLGLISSEEAKMKHELLAVQCGNLHSSYLVKFTKPPDQSESKDSPDGRERVKHLLKLATDRSSPSTDCEPTDASVR
ncbi:hypothetical protein HSX11_18665 [Oxalobacteraceae bacterium]|nr:hypothetical protein [Oxalobacteraceae bacterium]